MTDTPDLLQLDHAQRLLIDVIAQDCATNGSTPWEEHKVRTILGRNIDDAVRRDIRARVRARANRPTAQLGFIGNRVMILDRIEPFIRED
jgi:hypothetical protein